MSSLVGRFSSESGYKLSRATSDSIDIETHEFPDLLLRFGVLETIEARFTMNGWSFKNAITGTEDGFNDVSVGAKWSFVHQERGALPQASLLAEVTLPVGDPGFTDDFSNPKFLMLFSNNLSEQLSLTYNFGASIIRLRDQARGDRTVVDLPYTAMLFGYALSRHGLVRRAIRRVRAERALGSS